MDFTMITTIMHIILDSLLASFITKYDKLPSIIFRFMTWCKRLKRHVTVKHIDHEGYRFCYFTRGTPGPQPSILMLHGFSLNKDIWLNILKKSVEAHVGKDFIQRLRHLLYPKQLFPKDLHVICVDLPGHGDTTRFLGESYTIAAQAKRMHQFVEWTGLNKKPFHLVGMSMGGMVAGVYAANYPSEVCALSLLCPAGVRNPTESDFFLRFRELVYSKETSDSTLVSVNEKEAEELLELCLHQPNFIKTQLLKGYLHDRRPHRMFFVTCFLDVSSAESRYSLHDNMRRIRAPTQIIWGRDDKVFDSSGAEVLATAIPNSKVHILERCGHFIALERPRKSAKLLLEFYRSTRGAAEDKKEA